MVDSPELLGRHAEERPIGDRFGSSLLAFIHVFERLVSRCQRSDFEGGRIAREVLARFFLGRQALVLPWGLGLAASYVQRLKRVIGLQREHLRIVLNTARRHVLQKLTLELMVPLVHLLLQVLWYQALAVRSLQLEEGSLRPEQLVLSALPLGPI